MRKLTLLALLTLVVALPLQADSKHQSYISYDDGGTVVRPGDDDREMEARVNLPVFPGDEVITSRRGRTELRLADGNVLALDRATALRLQSVLDSYEGEAAQTLAELRYGKVAVYRVRASRDDFRLDTPSATYFASSEALFTVETDSRGRDRVAVFDGVIEVRTPLRSTRLRSGEQADVDDRGMYDVASYSRHSADDFERWFASRAERYGARTSRYLDRSLAYYDDELNRHGSWVYISHYGWAWRPYVSAGWRPYYNGYWMRSRYGGCLTWVSYEPWGWVPYHYGRWSYDPYYGWFWVPGVGYAPAWVYWWYGSGYVGWAPAGWWDLHRPYYPWAYRPYHGRGLQIGFGFYGRVRVNDVDLRPWTFVDANTIVSNRVDRAALTTDAVRGRLLRERDGFATVSSDPARFTREEFRDPAAAINRRWAGVDTGRAGAGPAASPVVDITPFIRRDNDLPGSIRDRVIRTPAESGGGRAVAGGGGSGGLAPIGGGGLAPIGGGNVAPVGRGGLAPVGPEGDRPGADTARDRINRGGSSGGSVPAPVPGRGQSGAVDRGDAGANRGDDAAGRIRRGDEGAARRLREDVPARTPDPPATGSDWRDRVSRPAGPPPREDQPATRTPEVEAPAREGDWRGRISRPAEPAEPRREPAGRASDGSAREVPRRVIDRIGGARVEPGSGDRGRSSSPPPRSVDRPSSSSGGSSSSGSSSSAGSSSPPPSRSSDGGARSNDGGSSRSSDSGGASRESGGRIKRDN